MHETVGLTATIPVVISINVVASILLADLPFCLSVRGLIRGARTKPECGISTSFIVLSLSVQTSSGNLEQNKD